MLAMANCKSDSKPIKKKALSIGDAITYGNPLKHLKSVAPMIESAVILFGISFAGIMIYWFLGLFWRAHTAKPNH